MLENVLVGALYPLLILVIGVGMKVNKTLVTFKIYLRQICDRLSIDCGKDLD